MYQQQAAQAAAGRAEALTNEFLPGEGLSPSVTRDAVSSPAPAALNRYAPASPFHSP